MSGDIALASACSAIRAESSSCGLLLCPLCASQFSGNSMLNMQVALIFLRSCLSTAGKCVHPVVSHIRVTGNSADVLKVKVVRVAVA